MIQSRSPYVFQKLHLRTQLDNALPKLIVSLSLAYFALMASFQISLPGLYYDEVLFVNAATGGISDSFIDTHIAGIPVMLMSYIGALKAYIYAPIFALFGVSPAAVRLPAICISMLSLLITFFLARETFNPSMSALLVLVMALDPTFIFLSKLDFGPIVLMMFFKLLALLFFFRALRTTSVVYLWFVVLCCTLGLFDKLNFIWFIVALGVAAAVLFRSELAALYRRQRLGSILPMLVLMAIVVRTSIAMILPNLIATQTAEVGWIERASYVLSLYRRTMNGQELYAWITGLQLATATATNYLTGMALVIIIAAAGRRVYRRGGIARLAFAERVLGCYLLLFGLIFVQILATKKAGGPHHIMMLYPFHHMLSFAVLIGLTRAVSAHLRPVPAAHIPERSSALRKLGRALAHARAPQAGVLLTTIILGLLIVSEVNLGLYYTQAFAPQGMFDDRWSPAIYNLSQYVNQQQFDVLVFADWGIHNQIFALGNRQTRAKSQDLWKDFRQPQEPSLDAQMYERFFKGKRALILAHAPGAEVMPGARSHLRAFLAQSGESTAPVKLISTAQGKVIYELYATDGRSAESK